MRPRQRQSGLPFSGPGHPVPCAEQLNTTDVRTKNNPEPLRERPACKVAVADQTERKEARVISSFLHLPCLQLLFQSHALCEEVHTGICPRSLIIQRDIRRVRTARTSLGLGPSRSPAAGPLCSAHPSSFIPKLEGRCFSHKLLLRTSLVIKSK